MREGLHIRNDRCGADDANKRDEKFRKSNDERIGDADRVGEELIILRTKECGVSKENKDGIDKAFKSMCFVTDRKFVDDMNEIDMTKVSNDQIVMRNYEVIIFVESKG